MASETFLQFNMGWYAHAIFVDGKYPEVRASYFLPEQCTDISIQVMRTQIDEKSAAQGFEESRLPHFSDEDSAMILGSSDFLGMNFYTAEVVYPETSDISDVSFYADQDVRTYQDETWFVAGSSWLKVTPWGIRRAINWASRQFNQPDIYITENGFSDKLANLDDLQR